MKIINHRQRVAGFLIVGFFFILTFAGQVFAVNANIDRLLGADRYQTSAAISREGWETSDYAILARGDDFADALCAGPLAKKYNAPILLTEQHELNTSTLAELKRLGVKHLLITGGTGAISDQVETDLRAAGITDIKRFAGRDRYETSVEIAGELSNQSVVLATGEDFPDALSISVTAAQLGMPILLTRHDALPQLVKEYLLTKSVTKTYIIGGQAVIGAAIDDLVPGPFRIFGANRFQTNIAVIKEFTSGFNFSHIYVAVGEGPKGDEFADALAGAALVARTDSPLILVNNNLPEATGNYLLSKITPDTRVTGLGGQAAVPDSVLQSIPDLLITAVGNLEITPSKSTAGKSSIITLIYTLGEKFTNGTLELAFPDGLTAEQGKYQIGTETGMTFTGQQITDSGRKLTISGVAGKAGDRIRVTLTDTVVSSPGNYMFIVIADADGLTSFRLPSSGSGNGAKIFAVSSRQLETIQEKLITRNRPYQSLDPKGFVIHATASSGGTAQVFYNYFNSADRQSSVHYVADWIEIVQLIPENEVAWHAGYTANHRYLSIEMCEPKGTNYDQFREVWDRTVLLVADACVRYGWNVNDNIFSHYDISVTYNETDHVDPIGYLAKYGRTWDQLLEAIDNKIREIKNE